MTHSALSLRDAHIELEAIVKEVANLLFVAAEDVTDVYGDLYPATSEMWAKRSDLSTGDSHIITPYAYRFAEELVVRLIYGDEVGITYVGDRVLDGHSELDGDVGTPETCDDGRADR